MSEELAPGVYLKELPGARTIAGVPVLAWPLAAALVVFALVRLRRHRGVRAAS
jgi:hypothetical protein